MDKRSLKVNSLQQRLAALQEQKLKLEAQRDQELLKILHKTQAHNMDLFTLTGVLLEANKVIITNYSQAESWRYAGEKFLHPKRAAKAASFKSKAQGSSAQKLATA